MKVTSVKYHGDREKNTVSKMAQLLTHPSNNKAGYTATEVACGWAWAMFEVTRPFGQEQWGQKHKIIKK